MDRLPILLIPGLGATPRLYSHQIGGLWKAGPVMVANHTAQTSMRALAQEILKDAPPAFALAGLSMGGYIAFEILRQAPQRVLKLALLDTTARADTPEQKERRQFMMSTAQNEDMVAIAELLFPVLVHQRHSGDERLRSAVEEMLIETGVEAFVRQQIAIAGRPDSRPSLANIRCPVTVLVGDGDEVTPYPLAEEIAEAIEGARLVEVPRSGHLSTLENPQFVTSALLDWLRY